MNTLRILAESSEGPNTELLWLVFLGVGFFFLVIMLGWWVSSGNQDQHGTKQGSGTSEKIHPNDLIKIEGIGPKVVKILNQAGIESFAQLADAKIDEVQEALNKAGLQMMNPDGWIDQAKLAAKGDWKNFEKLQRELKGGRKKN